MAKKKKKGLRCRSVGAIVKNRRGEYLVEYRKEKPKGLAFPAGHIEVGESPDNAAKRELFEETGIRSKHVRRVLKVAILGCCKRGAKKHLWYVYRVEEYSGQADTKEKKKHAFVKFMSPKKIREYIKLGDFDPAWVEILKQLGICNRSAPNLK